MIEAAAAQGRREPLVVGRYALFDAIASGGMATVHFGRLLGPAGFGRTAAIKRLHSHYANDPEFVAMFLDEARIVSRIVHPNVVPMIDVLESKEGLFLVMEYVHGESLSKLLRSGRAHGVPIPIGVIGSILHGALLGLHAAHETKGEDGALLGVVHRDVSPQNIMVGLDGVARVLDFGVAKAAGRAQVTREGQIKGKLTYMAPEQLRGKVDRRADVFAAAVVLWEALTGHRLHDGASEVAIITRVVKGDFPQPSARRPDVSPELDRIVLRGLSVQPERRFATARDMAIELERTVDLASPRIVAEWVDFLAKETLEERARKVVAMEAASLAFAPPSGSPPPVPAHHGATARPPPPRPWPPGVERPARPRGSRNFETLALVAVCAMLTVVGLVLGGYALLVPRPRPDATPALSPAPPTPAEADATSPTPVVAPKPACAPYSLDDAGHRRYNLECMSD